MRSMRLVISGVVALVLTVVGTVASATPPLAGKGAPVAQKAREGAALIGRVRIRGQIVDLTLHSLAPGGDASGLVEGYASPVHADVDRDLTRRSTER